MSSPHQRKSLQDTVFFRPPALCWNPTETMGQAQSLFGLPQHLSYSKIIYIMIFSLYAVKYLHDLFSKHGAFDAKAQGEPALLWQEHSGGTDRTGQGAHMQMDT